MLTFADWCISGPFPVGLTDTSLDSNKDEASPTTVSSLGPKGCSAEVNISIIRVFQVTTVNTCG